MSGGHYIPNRVTAYGPVAETTASVQNPRLLRSQAIQNYELQIVHNCLDMAVTSMVYHCKHINKFVLLLGRKCVQFKRFSPITQYLGDVRLETTIITKSGSLPKLDKIVISNPDWGLQYLILKYFPQNYIFTKCLGKRIQNKPCPTARW